MLVETYIYKSICRPVVWQVVIDDEIFRDVAKLSYKISLAREALQFNDEAILALYSGE